MSEELEADLLPRTLDEDSGQNCREDLSRLERDMLVEAEAQEPLLSAAAPSSPRPHPHSSDLARPLMDQEPDHIRTKCGGLEELRHGSPPCTQVEDGGPQEEQHQKTAVDAMRKARDSDGEPENVETLLARVKAAHKREDVYKRDNLAEEAIDLETAVQELLERVFLDGAKDELGEWKDGKGATIYNDEA
jgi:hypothetical protein